MDGRKEDPVKGRYIFFRLEMRSENDCEIDDGKERLDVLRREEKEKKKGGRCRQDWKSWPSAWAAGGGRKKDQEGARAKTFRAKAFPRPFFGFSSFLSLDVLNISHLTKTSDVHLL